MQKDDSDFDILRKIHTSNEIIKIIKSYNGNIDKSLNKIKTMENKNERKMANEILCELNSSDPCEKFDIHLKEDFTYYLYLLNDIYLTLNNKKEFRKYQETQQKDIIIWISQKIIVLFKNLENILIFFGMQTELNSENILNCIEKLSNITYCNCDYDYVNQLIKKLKSKLERSNFFRRYIKTYYWHYLAERSSISSIEKNYEKFCKNKKIVQKYFREFEITFLCVRKCFKHDYDLSFSMSA